MRGLMRPLAFAAGGTVGGFLVLLFLYGTNPASGFALNGALVGLATPGGEAIRFPASLLVGTGISLLAWLGWALGHAHWAYLASRPGHLLSRLPLVVALAALYLVLGVGLGVLVSMDASFNNPAVPPWVAGALLLGPLVVGIPLGFGYVSGYGEHPPAFFTAFVGLIYGPLVAFWFALVAGITVMVLPPAPLTVGARFRFPPVAEAIILLLVLTSIGLGLGVVTGCAEAVGLLLHPPKSR